MTMDDLLLHQDGPGLLAARAWHDAEIRKAHKRMENCTPEELGRLQGNIEQCKRFLKIFEGLPNGG
jgi:hypothetical protein